MARGFGAANLATVHTSGRRWAERERVRPMVNRRFCPIRCQYGAMLRPMARILLHHDVGPSLAALLDARAADDLRIDWCSVADRGHYRAALVSTDVLFHVLDPVTDEMLSWAPHLKLIQKLGVGVNTIDLEAARQRGVMVANQPGVNRRAVAEHALLLMLATLRRLPMLHAATAAGDGWQLPASATDGLGELGGRRVGFVGFGAIPQSLAPVLAAMGCEVVHHRRSSDAPGWLPLEELLATSDVISVHLPSTPETVRMLDRRRLAACKPGSILINTGRGDVIDESALIDALRDGPLAAAGLDVFEREPATASNALLSLPNVVVTPHVAWLTDETFARCLDRGIDNARRVRDGLEPQDRVV